MRKKHVKDYVADKTIEGGYRYIGMYYVDDISDVERKKAGILHMLIGLLQIVLVVLAAFINCMGNRTIYVVIPMECTMFCALNLCLGAYRFLKNSNRMELRHYEDSYQKMVQSVTIAFFLNIGSIIGQIVVISKGYFYLDPIDEYFLLGAILIMTAINGIEWKMQRKLIADVRKETVKS